MTLELEEKVAILRRFGFYTEAPPSVRKQMEAVARVESIPRGTYYFHEEDDSRRVGLVHEGALRVFKSGRSGREVTLFHVESGEACVLNILAVLSGRRFPATSVVEVPVRALMFPADDFRDWFDRCVCVRQFVLDLIGARFAALMTLIDEISFERMDRRLAGFLLTRLGKAGDAGPLKLTHEEIARQLGSAREVVGRLLKDLEKDGAIALSRASIRVTDANRLRRYLRPPGRSKSG